MIEAQHKPKDDIKTARMVKHFPEAAMTELVNKLGDRFISCEKEDGQWVLTYLNNGRD